VKNLGALITDPAFALHFRTIEPVPAAPRALLILLHGVGGNETNLGGLAAAVPQDTLVVLPRGPLAVGPLQFAWFRVAFGASGPQIAADEAEESRSLLIRFIEQLQTRHGVDAQHTTIAGFSQGGIMSASVALSAPERANAFAVLSGRILPELEPAIAPKERLSKLRGFVGHGKQDVKLPVSWAERADAWLHALGVSHVTKLYPAGHELTPAMVGDFLNWLQSPSQVTAASLHFDPERTTLSRPDASVVLAPGWTRVAREHLRAWPPRPVDMEKAIALIEDELMRSRHDLHGLQVTSDEPVLREIARAAGLSESNQRLDREIVERTFERLAAVTLGRPNTQERLPEDLRFAAILLILRELMHHLDISSISLQGNTESSSLGASQHAGKDRERQHDVRWPQRQVNHTTSIRRLQ